MRECILYPTEARAYRDEIRQNWICRQASRGHSSEEVEAFVILGDV